MDKQPVKAGLFYSEEHEWLDTSGPVRVGVSAVATDALGEVVFAELPEVGAQVEAGEPCGELESTKTVSDLFSPVSGTVTAVNEDIEDNPALVNEDPYGAGWLFEVELSDTDGTTEGLLDAATYAEKFDAEVA